MATKEEIERLAILETEVKEIKTTLRRIETKLDGLDNRYALKDEVTSEVRRLESQVKGLKWQTIPLTVLLTAVITALVYYFVNTKIGV